MIKKSALQLKQDIYRFVTDNQKAFNYRVVQRLPLYYTQAWFTVDGIDYWIYIQNYSRHPGKLHFIKLTDAKIKSLTVTKLRELRRRCLELR